MSSGKIHNRVTLLSGVATAIPTAIFMTPAHGIATFLGSLTGLILTPDNDVDGGSRANKHSRTLGLGLPFEILMRPYSLAYRHRSNASHMPVLSTLWRVFYVLVPFITLLNKNQPTSRFKLFLLAIPAQLVGLIFWLPAFWFWLNPTPLLFWWFLGLVLSDILHWGLDCLG